MSVKSLKENGYTAIELKTAGCRPAEMRRAGLHMKVPATFCFPAVNTARTV